MAFMNLNFKSLFIYFIIASFVGSSLVSIFIRERPVASFGKRNITRKHFAKALGKTQDADSSKIQQVYYDLVMNAGYMDRLDRLGIILSKHDVYGYINKVLTKEQFKNLVQHLNTSDYHAYIRLENSFVAKIFESIVSCIKFPDQTMKNVNRNFGCKKKAYFKYLDLSEQETININIINSWSDERKQAFCIENEFSNPVTVSYRSHFQNNSKCKCNTLAEPCRYCQANFCLCNKCFKPDTGINRDVAAAVLMSSPGEMRVALTPKGEAIAIYIFDVEYPDEDKVDVAKFVNESARTIALQAILQS